MLGGHAVPCASSAIPCLDISAHLAECSVLRSRGLWGSQDKAEVTMGSLEMVGQPP